MKKILIVDDMAIFREPIAASLRLAKYETAQAANGREALALVQALRPALILVDLAMPVMDGIGFLKALRADPVAGSTPVILLTAVADRDSVLEAAKLGIQGYMLKSRFSLAELIDRVGKLMAAPVAGANPALPRSHAATGTPAAARGPVLATEAEPLTPLLTRETCIQRCERAFESKTLSGVVLQVIRLAASPRGDMSELARLVGRDPLLAARVLQAANSAAYVSTRGAVSTIPDAVRQIGCNAVRNLAASVGIFDAMPATAPDGFNPIRCWQHSFAVAQLSEMLACTNDGDRVEGAGLSYVVGLCHDLGEIIFHTQFGVEYRQVLEASARTGRRRDLVEREMLGMTQGELAQIILRCMSLPDEVRRPIEEYHASPAMPVAGRRTLAQVLYLADHYANGLLLASSQESEVRSFVRAECKAAAGAEHPPIPEAAAFRAQVLALTSMLARLSGPESDRLAELPFQSAKNALWVVRDRALSAFDPVTAAIESMAAVTVRDQFPTLDDARAQNLRGIVAITRSTSASGLTAPDLAAATRVTGLPVLWLANQASDAPCPPHVSQTLHGPFRLCDLAHQLKSLTQSSRVEHVAAA